MRKLICALALLGPVSLATTGCGLDRSSSVLGPTSDNSAASGGSSGGATGTTGSGSSLVGTWTSSNTTPALATPTSCGNFQYQITSQTATAISGTFSGTCGGGTTLSGNAVGQIDGTAIAITVTGNATMPGTTTCPVTLTGNGTIEDGGNTLRVPFSGTTCLGPVSGIEVLRKPGAAAVAAVFGEPALVAPAANVHLTSLRTRFVANNASKTGPIGPTVYRFELAHDEAFTNVMGTWNVPEMTDQTWLDLPIDLAYTNVYYWHVRAFDGSTTGPWSRTQAFATTDPPPPPPPPPSSGGPVACAANGPAIIACVMNAYPDKLRAGVSSSERVQNMEFLRNRVIETGICNGMDIGLNLKRGGPSVSVDAIVWRHGFDDIIDIGFAYDDTSRPLTLQWVSVIAPFYLAYTPRPSCR
jgi:hypothetical protein